METREQYDPEDLEQLLLERPYDALLDEERAFAHRHLSGREEYEAMRQLLLAVTHDEERTTPVDTPPVVRDRVLQAFREARQPRWSYSLNALKALLFPPERPLLLRPAFAFGLVALFATGLLLMQGTNTGLNGPQLAELRDTDKEDGIPRTPVPAAAEEPMPTAAEHAEQEAPPAPSTDAVILHEFHAPAPPPPTMEPMVAMEAMEAAPAMELEPYAEDALSDHVVPYTAMDSETTKSIQQTQVVTTKDLASNMSYADTDRISAKHAEKARKAAAAETRGAVTVPQDPGPAIMAMLRSAW